jgi:glucose/arabinose dehydrogenase
MNRRRRLLAAGLAAVAMLVAGCSLLGSGGEPRVTSDGATTSTAGPGATTSAPATSAPATSAPTTGAPVSLSGLKISLTRVAEGFSSPLYVTNAGDDSGRLFVVEQTGKVRVVRDGKIVSGAFLDVSSLISTGGERGLLGLAFAPDYKTSGRFYVDYTDANGNTVVARYVATSPSTDKPKLSRPTRLLYIQQPYSNHNGGCLQFGPDGMLYIGMGDGGSGGDPENRAQNLSSPLGKLLRVDVSGATYSVPKDNPYAKSSYPKNIVWARGLRNPWRFSFDATRAPRLWIGDVGQNAWEEIDVVPASAKPLNYGWRKWEANHPYPPNSAAPSRTGFTFPIVEYPHPTGESVTGGYVYRGSRYPAMVGTYFYADYVKGWIAGIRTTDPADKPLAKAETDRLLDTDLSVSSFGVDQDGELYLTDLRGGLYRVEGRAK